MKFHFMFSWANQFGESGGCSQVMNLILAASCLFLEQIQSILTLSHHRIIIGSAHHRSAFYTSCRSCSTLLKTLCTYGSKVLGTVHELLSTASMILIVGVNRNWDLMGST